MFELNNKVCNRIKKYRKLNPKETVDKFTSFGCIPIEKVNSPSHRVKVYFFQGSHTGYIGVISLATIAQKKFQAKLSDKRGKRELNLRVLLPKEKVRYVRNTLVANGYRVLNMPTEDIKALDPITVIGIDLQVRKTNWNTLDKLIKSRKNSDRRPLLQVREKNTKILEEWADKHGVILIGNYQKSTTFYTGMGTKGYLKDCFLTFKWSTVTYGTAPNIFFVEKEHRFNVVREWVMQDPYVEEVVDKSSEVRGHLVKIIYLDSAVATGKVPRKYKTARWTNVLKEHS